MEPGNDEDSAKYVRVSRTFLRIMGFAMLAYFLFDLTDAITDFVSAIPNATYLRLLVIPLGFYLTTGFYCLNLSRQRGN